jgi:competence protein ComEC
MRGKGQGAAFTGLDERVFRCDSLGCIGVVKGKTVALIRHPGALEEDCRVADIVIAPFTISRKCRAARVMVDRRMLKAKGAHALYGQRQSPQRAGKGPGRRIEPSSPKSQELS